MPRFLLKPRWIAFTLAVLAAMVAMINLGLWQLRRLDERKAFNHLITQRLAEPPADAQPALAASDPDQWTWRTLTLRGTYTDHPTVEVVNRSQDGTQGRWLLATLRTDTGETAIVNRGFLAAELAAPLPPTGPVELTVRAKPTEQRHTGQTADDASVSLTQVRRVDVPLLREQLGAPNATMYFDVLSSAPTEAALQPPPLPALDEGPHLSYAVQWFIFTLCAAVGWVLAVHRSSGTSTGTRRRGTPPIDEERSAALGTGVS